MILYEPAVTVYGWDKKEGVPLLTIEGETRSATLPEHLGASLMFKDKADLFEFVEQLNQIAMEFRLGEDFKPEVSSEEQP